MQNEELIEGKHYYINKDGLIVFTEQYHLEKGCCCGNGCLHCPYDYKNVPETCCSILLSTNQSSNKEILLAAFLSPPVEGR